MRSALQAQPVAFVSDQAKVAFMVSHLTGRAAAWASAEWSRDSYICQSFTVFQDTMSKIFDYSIPAREASRALMQIKQRHRQVIDNAVEFRTVAADSGWDTPALIDAFMNGLSEPIKDHIAALELPQDLEAIIAMSIHEDNRPREGRTAVPTVILPSRTSLFPTLAGSGKTTPLQGSEKPMQLGRTKISPERRRRLQQGCCFYCGQPGDQLATGPGKD